MMWTKWMQARSSLAAVWLGLLATVCKPGSLHLGIADSNIPSSELDALSDLYAATAGENWVWNSAQDGVPWNFSVASPNPCADNWQGVNCSCTSTFCVVVQLNLPSHNLVGSLPASLSNLTELIQLVLSNNRLVSSLPTTLSSLRNLVTLKVDSNQLSGVLPPWLPSLLNLLTLDVGSNLFYGSIDLFMPWLVSFAANNNRLTGTLPSFQLYSNLSSFDVSSNSLKGHLSSTFNHSLQPYLSYVDFSDNSFSGSVPANIFLMPSLEYFGASVNCFKGEVPFSYACQAKNMSVLALDGLSSASSCRRALHPSESYFNAFILQHQVRGSLPACLWELANLTVLHMAGNAFTGSIPGNVIVPRGLLDLTLSHNRLTGSIPAGLQSKPMTQLDLSYNRIVGSLLEEFYTYPPNSNASVTFHRNKISGRVPVALRELREVNILEGNVFFCGTDRSVLPKHDPSVHTYICGSTAVDFSLYTWLAAVALTVMGAALLTYGLFARKRIVIPSFLEDKWRIVTEVLRAKDSRILRMIASPGANLSHVPSLHTIVPSVDLLAIHKLMDFFESMRDLHFVCMVLLVVCLVPLYVALAHYYHNYKHEYGWKISAVFLHGSTAGYILVFSTGLVFVVFYRLCRRMVRYTIHLTPPSQFSLQSFTNAHQLLTLIRLGLLFALNLTVVVVVDCCFAYIFFNYDLGIVVWAQAAMGAFRLVWNESALWWLIPLTKVSTSPKARTGSKSTSSAIDYSMPTVDYVPSSALEGEQRQGPSPQSDLPMTSSLPSVIPPTAEPTPASRGDVETSIDHNDVHLTNTRENSPPHSPAHDSALSQCARGSASVEEHKDKDLESAPDENTVVSPFTEHINQSTLTKRVGEDGQFGQEATPPLTASSHSSSPRTISNSHSKPLPPESSSHQSYVTLSLTRKRLARRISAFFTTTYFYNTDEVGFVGLCVLINNILLPSVAVMFVSSDCFYNAILRQNSEHDSYLVKTCEMYTMEDGVPSCQIMTPILKRVVYDPPFVYSYQCAAGITEAFASVFIFMMTLTGLIIPVGKLAMHAMYHTLGEQHPWKATLASVLPDRFQSPCARHQSQGLVLFQRERMVISIVSHLTIIVAFGIIYPPIAFLGCFSIAMITWTEQYILGFLISAADRLQLNWYRTELCKQCSGTVNLFYVTARQVGPFACCIVGFIIFDTVGYAEGWGDGLIASAVFVCWPILLYYWYNFFWIRYGYPCLVSVRRRGLRSTLQILWDNMDNDSNVQMSMFERDPSCSVPEEGMDTTPGPTEARTQSSTSMAYIMSNGWKIFRGGSRYSTSSRAKSHRSHREHHVSTESFGTQG